MTSVVKTAASITTDGSVISGGSILWANPSYASSNDGSYATQVPNTSTTGARYLVLENFGFSIPSTATINGIIISINRRKTNSSGQIQDTVVQLKQGSTLIGSNVAIASDWPTTATVQTYGGSSNMLGTSLTPSDINNSNFGMALRIYNVGGFGAQGEVDNITIEVFYTEAVTPTPTPTVTNTTTPTMTVTPTNSATVTPTTSATSTPEVTHTPSATPSPTVTVTPTETITPTPTVTPSTTPVLVPVTEGFDMTIPDGVEVVFLDPVGTICNGTIRLPANPANKQTVEILTSEKISTINVYANVGQTLVPNPPTIMLSGSGFSYRFNAASNKWFRRW